MLDDIQGMIKQYKMDRSTGKTLSGGAFINNGQNYSTHSSGYY